MAVRYVLRMGHPLLRKKSRPLELAEMEWSNFQLLIKDMFETMEARDGIGLSAPQIARPLCVIVYEIKANERYKNLKTAVEPTVLVNPYIISRSAERNLDWEGCLSLPGLRGEVPRHQWVEIEALDREGNKLQRKIEGFEARVVQHEMDHLNGILFIDRMYNLDKLSYTPEYHRFHAEESSE